MKMFVAKIMIIMMCNYLETKNAPKYFWSVFLVKLYLLSVVVTTGGNKQLVFFVFID